ncbi:hypothetical protein [Oceaniferula marina]|nr:hypothetical protein [Oceaniferula marina]
MKLVCHPQGICSYNYRIFGDQYEASTVLRVGGSGAIACDGLSLLISHEGIINEKWHLRSSTDVLGHAYKSGIFSNSYEVVYKGKLFHLRSSGLGRSMHLFGENEDASIEPDHAFTRRAKICGSWRDSVPVLFGFWLTVNQWARMASNSAATGGG